MNPFLYYLPDVQTVTAEAIRAAGLDYVLGGDVFSQRGVRGPDGRQGSVWGPGVIDAGTLGVWRDRQEWTPLPGGRAYVGWAAGRPPGPDDLRRPGVDLGGRRIPLPDPSSPREWTVPVVITADGQSGLPQYRYWDEAGKLQRAVRKEYRALYEQADRILSHLKSGEAISEDELAAACVDALALHYRLGRAEAGTLELLTGTGLILMAWTMVDWASRPEGRAELDKLKEPDNG